MPYRLISAQRPRSRPTFDSQKHDLEPVGTVFTAARSDDKPGEGTWLLSTEGSGDSAYPNKWYHASWCTSVSDSDPLPAPAEGLESALLVVFKILKRLWNEA
jgi:hypothetical protein